MTNLYDDLRYAVRSLRKAPLFTLVAVLSMGLGIAANTSVFTLVDQVILRTLPVDRPQELVQVTARGDRELRWRRGRRHRAVLRDVPRPPRPKHGVRDHVLPRADERDARQRRRHRTDPDGARVRQLLPGAGRPAGSRAVDRSGRGPARGWRAGGGAVARVLAGALRGRRLGDRTHRRRSTTTRSKSLASSSRVSPGSISGAPPGCTCRSRCSHSSVRRGCTSMAAASGGCRSTPGSARRHHARARKGGARSRSMHRCSPGRPRTPRSPARQPTRESDFSKDA